MLVAAIVASVTSIVALLLGVAGSLPKQLCRVVRIRDPTSILRDLRGRLTKARTALDDGPKCFS